MCGARGKCKHGDDVPVGTQCTQCNSIQTLDQSLPLLKPADFATEELRLAHGQHAHFPFDGVGGLDVTNVSPPCLLHDVSEGIAIRILQILFCDIKKKLQEIKKDKKTLADIETLFVKLFEAAYLPEGAATVWLATKKKDIKIEGKGIQKMQLFTQLEAIFLNLKIRNKFYSLPDLLSPECLKLFYTAKKFTLLAFECEPSEDDLVQMKNLAHDLAHQIAQTTKDDTWMKLHQVCHYHELVKKFGPLYLYATWFCEAKHQYSKAIARRTKNFINLSHSIMQKHAVDRAETLRSLDYENYDFFPESQLKARLQIFPKYENMEKKGFKPKVELDRSSDQCCKFDNKGSVLYRIPGKRGEWFQITKFFKGGLSGEEIFCLGHKFTLKDPVLEFGGPIQEIECKKNFQFNYISMSSLKHYYRDFLVQSRGKSYISFWVH